MLCCGGERGESRIQVIVNQHRIQRKCIDGYTTPTPDTVNSLTATAMSALMVAGNGNECVNGCVASDECIASDECVDG